MRIIDFFWRWNKKVSYWAFLICPALLVIMMLSCVADVFARYVLGGSVPMAHEILEWCQVCAVFLAISWAVIKGRHVRIDVLIRNRSDRIKTLINGITAVLSTILMALVSWRSAIEALYYQKIHMMTGTLEIPKSPVMWIICLGTGLFTIAFIGDIAQNLVVAGKKYGDLWLRLLLGSTAVLLMISFILWYDNLPRISLPLAGILGVLFLLVLMFSGMGVGYAMGLCGFLGLTYTSGLNGGWLSLIEHPIGITYNYSYGVLKLFGLMGFLVFTTGLGTDLYKTAHAWLGQFRGGLASATVAACAAFGAVTSSSTMGSIIMSITALPEMEKYKYKKSLAVGAVTCAGTLGILIPPSTPMLIYGLLADVSVGEMFIAGIVPGILLAVLLIGFITIRCTLNPTLGPPGPKTSFKEKAVSLKLTWPVLCLFALVIGGIYGGIFSPTEAGGIGAFGAFVIALATRRMTVQRFYKAQIEMLELGAVTFFILIGGKILCTFLATTRIPFMLADAVVLSPLPPTFMLIGLLVIWLFLGCFMPGLAMILLTVPIFMPVVHALGFSPIWFGILMVMGLEIAAITPPVGVNLFMVQAVTKTVPMATIMGGTIPFIIPLLVAWGLVVAFPQIALFLPQTMRG